MGAAFLDTVKTVLFGFLGVRKRDAHDKAQINPVHLIIAAVIFVVLFIYNLFSTLKSGAPAAQKQWEGADSIDWTHLPTPAPYHTFETPPVLK